MTRDAATTSRIMGKIKRRDTTPELILRRALHRMDIRYRVDTKNVYGRPDISIMKYKLAVFVDGDFWHGNEHKVRKLSKLEDLFPTNAGFWCSKILGNIERDRQVNQRLMQEGWTVIRIWTSTIFLNPNEAAESIYKALQHLKGTSNSVDSCLGHLS
ncbi:very short patch repair endonuclease [Synechococcus sp. CS-602]|uniref:very short patch repair endonuclease n=1 Tax=Synechococcaceae TaxID=1890426 RepID=UPI0008FF6D53|nr:MULTISPECIES: very short patch repair endonuclease [Synechococcaceae]MCT0204979.1 very short patch repair endonuclease [Synechococcus sp. CS-602]MCT0245113.1 very short patch repair endonuclease [Synechococcus sp. CS-601]MCT4364596.1 very short patch repair endonuclease [Candidatus Regnicoccus frigidus MAG-AL1]MCT4368437.1 very short patch repair endonuclease [Candidatus Regnicoccus frigidus MAG-AL2]